MNKKKYKHDYYLKNKDKFTKMHREYYESHKEQIIDNCKKYVENHKIKTAIYQKEYRKKHKEKLLIQHEIARKKRLLNNIDFKLRYNLRVRLYKALHRNQKSSTTIDLLGCDIKFFKNYLESKFIQSMSWSNYGLWEIDHIKPCASFDLSKPEEQKKCFHYTNLQPLWEIDNIRKGKKC